jgi:hypothetical protein
MDITKPVLPHVFNEVREELLQHDQCSYYAGDLNEVLIKLDEKRETGEEPPVRAQLLKEVVEARKLDGTCGSLCGLPLPQARKVGKKAGRPRGSGFSNTANNGSEQQQGTTPAEDKTIEPIAKRVKRTPEDTKTQS